MAEKDSFEELTEEEKKEWTQHFVVDANAHEIHSLYTGYYLFGDQAEIPADLILAIGDPNKKPSKPVDFKFGYRPVKGVFLSGPEDEENEPVFQTIDETITKNQKEDSEEPVLNRLLLGDYYEFKVHRAILGAHSEYIRELINGTELTKYPQSPNDLPILSFPEIRPDAFVHLLGWCYCGPIMAGWMRDWTRNGADLIRLGHQFIIPILVHHCALLMIDRLEYESELVWQLLPVCYEFENVSVSAPDIKHLKDACLDYLVDDFEQHRTHPNFKLLDRSVLDDLMIKLYQRIHKSEDESQQPDSKKRRKY